MISRPVTASWDDELAGDLRDSDALLSRRALCESCFARGYENEGRGQMGHGSPGSVISQNYSFLRARSVTAALYAPRSGAPVGCGAVQLVRSRSASVVSEPGSTL
jgi:hypothetical protein